MFRQPLPSKSQNKVGGNVFYGNEAEDMGMQGTQREATSVYVTVMSQYAIEKPPECHHLYL
jgi:hypothetical protein